MERTYTVETLTFGILTGLFAPMMFLNPTHFVGYSFATLVCLMISVAFYRVERRGSKDPAPKFSDFFDRSCVGHAIYTYMNGWMHDDPRHYPKWQAVLCAYRDALHEYCAACYCHLYDHKIESDGGWVGPDSGGDDFYCTRCGWSKRITYY